MEQLKTWLNRLKLKYKVNSKRNFVSIIYKLLDQDWEVRIFVGDEWYQIVARVGRTENIAPEKRESVYHSLLVANYDLNEVTYSADVKGNLYSENDVPKTADFDSFRSEFFAVVYGIKYWVQAFGSL